jgi:hypothetical protein
MTLEEALAIEGSSPALQTYQVGRRLKATMDALMFSPATKRYVNSAAVASGDGLSWDSAKKTIQEAVDAAADGDILFMKGTFTEAVTCAKKLTFFGAGNTVNGCTWMESVAGQTLLTLTATDCLVTGIRFRVPTAGGIAISMTNSDYTVITGNTFQGRTGSYYGIYVAGGSQWKITDNVFLYLNTATYGCAILGHSTTVMPASVDISGNTFHSNLRHVKASIRQSFVHDNLFQEIGLDADNSDLTATVKLDIYGEIAGAQYNTVTRNMFQGTYSISGGYKPGTSDNWYGNKSDKVSTTGVTAEGTTTAVPA